MSKTGMSKTIAVLAGDGIGSEVMAEGVRVLEWMRKNTSFKATLESAPVGGAAYDLYGHPLPEETLNLVRRADAVLLGAVGAPKYDTLPREVRPEKALLGLRSQLHLFANLRPALLYAPLAQASTLKPEVVAGLDILIVRELTGDLYFGEPRGTRTLPTGERQAYNTMLYSEHEITRVARVAFEAARKRKKRVCSIDKSNVLEVSGLWREMVERTHKEYPDVELSHMLVDNAAMQLVRNPKQFDVIVTGNLFGDILSDEASMLTGSIGMLPSASLDANNKGMYEPVHGSAPDIAGKGVANPLATILSVAMMLRYTFNEAELADRIERAVARVLDQGLRTGDIYTEGTKKVGTVQMGDAVIAALAN